MATPHSLIIPRKPRRSFNVVGALVLLGVVLLIAAGAIYLLASMNTAHAVAMTGLPSGEASTMKASDVPGPDPVPAVRHDAAVVAPRVTQPAPAAAATVAPQRAYSGSGGDQGDSAAREAQRRRIEREEQEQEARQQRIADSAKSMGAIAIADPSQDAAPQSDATGAPQEYAAAPSGPVLARDTKIPVVLSDRSIDSTFGSQYAVPVTADVLDERGQRVLIPRGSTCFITTTQGGVDGQARIYVEADECKLPGFQRLALDKFPVVDADGATGLKARVDDHGAGRRNRGNAFMSVPSMVAGTVIPGIGGAAASTAISASQSASAGRAIPGPTLYVDASPEHPRAFSILVTRDVAMGGN
jgi:type IV secretory pathway VirB10-like protein